jgi:uncharacterized protein with gpF-like domain
MPRTEKKVKTVEAIRPNAGVAAAYRAALDKLVKEMIHSFDYWIRAAYKRSPPHSIAMDALPAAELSRLIKRLGKRWQKKFNELSGDIAQKFAEQSLKTSDAAFKSALANAGWTISFKMTPETRDILYAIIQENVSLIKSIPSQYATEVQGIVMRSYTSGKDLHTMTNELQSRYKVTRDRAALISRDQSAKATSSLHTARQLEIGITRAIWKHSSAGKVPRQDHVAANGKEYDVAEGCYISGEYIKPGQLINCRCTCKSILPY